MDVTQGIERILVEYLKFIFCIDMIKPMVPPRKGKRERGGREIAIVEKKGFIFIFR